MGLRVELFAAIRSDARVEGLSIRELARRHGVHRRTVRQALTAAQPPARKVRVGVAWRLEPFKVAIDAMLTADLDAPRKQRHTARRVLARLAEEHGATEFTYSTVRDYVRIRRTEIDVAPGRRVEVFGGEQRIAGRRADRQFREIAGRAAGAHGGVTDGHAATDGRRSTATIDRDGVQRRAA